jgi:hypothetical protein
MLGFRSAIFKGWLPDQKGREIARQSGAMNKAQISQCLQSKGIR